MKLTKSRLAYAVTGIKYDQNCELVPHLRVQHQVFHFENINNKIRGDQIEIVLNVE